MAKRTTPPKTKKTSKATAKKAEAQTTLAKTTWEAFQLPGIDVRMWRAIHVDSDGDEIIPFGVPDVDPSYVFREDLVREIAWAVWPHDNDNPALAPNWTPCLLSGPKGSGKTSLVLQIAARCNIPVWRVNMNVGTSVRHLKGRVGAEPGRTVFIPGVLTSAMERGGWLVMDEFSAMTPPVALSIFPALEPDGAVLLEDAQPPRYVRRHPAFRVFATDNVLGCAQEMNRFGYAGTNPDVNDALMDRFGSFIEVGYMNRVDEANAVKGKVPLADQDTLEGILRVADGIRQSNEIASGFSTRMVIDWVRRVTAGQINAAGKEIVPDTDDDAFILQAAQGAFLRRQKSSIEKDAMVETIRRIFTIDGEGV